MMKPHRDVIFKLADEEEHLVFAEVYAPNVPDTDKDFMVPEEIKKMAYKFMQNMNLRNIDVQHNNQLVPNACVVESFIARKGDTEFIEGSWVVGIHVDDPKVWDQIKKGELNGFSMEGLVTRTERELELDIPPVIRGMTSKADDDHNHEFFVTYDVEGNLLGGQTSSAQDGHFHKISNGTTTDTTNDHHHRFSFVEGLG